MAHGKLNNQIPAKLIYHCLKPKAPNVSQGARWTHFKGCMAYKIT